MDLKTKLLKALTVQPVPYTIKAAGVDVFVRQWSAQERQTFQALVNGHKKETGQPLPDLYEQLFIRGLCDESHTRLFNDDEVVAARALNGAALEEFAQEVLRVNRLGAGDEEKKAPSPEVPS